MPAGVFGGSEVVKEMKVQEGEGGSVSGGPRSLGNTWQ